MDVLSRHGLNGVGHKVVLDRREDLHDVAALAPHVQVAYGGCGWHVSRSLADGKSMRPARGKQQRKNKNKVLNAIQGVWLTRVCGLQHVYWFLQEHLGLWVWD